MTPSDIIAAAKGCMGTPFQHQSRVPGLGMDCAGLLVHCFKRLDLPHIDEFGYPRSPYDGMLESVLASQPSLRQIPLSEAREGDWYAMRIKGAPQHVALHAGVIRGRIYIIHASSDHGKVVMHAIDDLWRPRLVHAYRMERPE